MSDDTQDDLFDVDSEVTETRVEDFLAARHLVPSVDWILKEIVSKGEGYEQKIATFWGVAKSCERTTNIVKGQELVSIKLVGSFGAESLVTGETWEVSVAYLPMKWAKRVEAALEAVPADDPNRKAKMALSIGIRATGKGIPYAWTVKTRMAPPTTPEMDDLKFLARGGRDHGAPRRITSNTTRTIEAEPVA